MYQSTLEAGLIDGDDLVDRVDLKAYDGVYTSSDNDVHEGVFILGARQVEPAPEVDGGYNLPPQVQKPARTCRCHGYAGDRLGPEDFLNAVYLNPKEELFQQERAVLLVVV